ncbi:hypothetical protein COR50_02405 [Chitinophaga caeni]|uniref:Uncharacterized protein n=1 Tax=Chitinophaga caeni TaxID=2029983 RepID=A0A291QQ34_9BACT|nr:hypothetical protein [Chitinophaga caeni]ATL46108.1 hypothetical protein COR50_02405 [Chitinophaga caeni]
MSSIDVLISPVIGGYIFIITCKLTKYYHQTVDRQKLIYNSIIMGVALLVFCLTLKILVHLSSTYKDEVIFRVCPIYKINDYYSILLKLIFDKEPTLSIKYACLTLMISYPMAIILNMMFKKYFSFNFAVQRWGTSFDRIIWNSLSDHYSKDKLIFIITKQNFIIVGYIQRLIEPIGYKYIAIIPCLKGYQDSNTKRWIILNMPPSPFANLNEITELQFINTQSPNEMVIPICEIVNMSKFDESLFIGISDLHKHIHTLDNEQLDTMIKTFKG